MISFHSFWYLFIHFDLFWTTLIYFGSFSGSHWLNNNRSQRSNSNNISNPTSDCESPSVNDTDCEMEDGAGSNSKTSQNVGSEPGATIHGTISEKHVYKYRCAQCSLAFKTAEKLALHSQYHVIRDSTKCKLCARSFRSVQALLKHVETSHTEVIFWEIWKNLGKFE